MSNEILIIEEDFPLSNTVEITHESMNFPLTYAPGSPVDRATKNFTKPFQVKRIIGWDKNRNLAYIKYFAIFENEKDALEQSFKLNIP